MHESIPDIDRNNYINKIKESLQSQIVNFISGVDESIPVTTWSDRITSCDVISTVTTTVPIKSGDMKDIKMYNKEMRKIKPSWRQKLTAGAYQNPFEETTYSNPKDKKNCSNTLKAEKNLFMNRLHRTRYIRSTVENISSIIIQRIYRGYVVRSHVNEIVHVWLERKKFRDMFKSRLTTLSDGEVVLKCTSDFRSEYEATRSMYASVIQRTFRCYTSRILLRRKRGECAFFLRQKASVKIQCLARKKSSKDNVQRRRARRILLQRYTAALKIQCLYRKFASKHVVAKRRYVLRWVSATIIQAAFRGRKRRQALLLYFATMEKAKRYIGARNMQRLVRGKIGRTRYFRIKLRCLYKKLFSATSGLQRVIRSFLARRKCRRLQESRKLDAIRRQEEALLEIQRSKADADKREAALLLESMDPLVQARVGNGAGVDTLYHDDPTAVSCATTDTGDTILIVAAKHGHLDIVRKCLQWGMDVSQENAAGENALVAAALSGHLHIVSYLLDPPSNSMKADAPIFLTSSGKVECSASEMAEVFIAAAKHSDQSYLRKLLQNHAIHINAKHAVTEVTAIHAACEAGSVDAIALLLKHMARLDVLDDMGQTPFHKASTCENGAALSYLLGLSAVGDSEVICSTSEQRIASLLAKDSDGKDCLLLAALHNRPQVVDMIQTALGNTERQLSSEIGWTPNDIDRTVKLALENQLTCLKIVIDAGYDTAWATESTGDTVAIGACRAGSMSVLEYLVAIESNFSVANNAKDSTFHAAAECSSQAVIPYLLTCAKKNVCYISPDLITAQNSGGDTPVHVAARHGSTLSYDLIAQKELGAAVQVSNTDGMTPLLLACASNQGSKIKELLDLQADCKAVDTLGRNCLWHYFFPSIGLESVAAAALNASLDIDIVISLLRRGCPLYSFAFDSSFSTKRDLLAYGHPVDKASDVLFDPIDVCAYELKFGIFSSILQMLAPEDCWRAALSCIHMDTSGKSLAAMFDSGAAVILSRYEPINTNQETVFVSDYLRSWETLVYHDLTIVGWAIKAKSNSALQYLLGKQRISGNSIVDVEGNSCLHYAAMYGTPSLVDVILKTGDDVVRLESVNAKGFTPAAMGAKCGDFQATKRLVKLGANARTALEGKYCSWILARARLLERRECNLQTGRIGNDDETWYPMSPDPNYTAWWAPKLR